MKKIENRGKKKSQTKREYARFSLYKKFRFTFPGTLTSQRKAPFA